jgi:hypothetical protein
MALVNKSLLIASTKNLNDDEMRVELDKFSNSIRNMTQGVINNAWHLLLMGDPGQGKTQTVVDTLNDSNAKWTGIKGTTSAIGLYKFFYEHRDYDVLTIDDSDAIYDSTEATEILKAAMDTKEQRVVSWVKQNQNLNSIGIPNQFVFNARVILITNKDLEIVEGKRPSKAQRLMNPVVDRTPVVKTGLPNRDWELAHINLLAERNEIIVFNEYNIPAPVRVEMVKFLFNHGEHFRSISFRTLGKMCAFYKEDPNTWQDLTLMTVA